MRNDVWHLIFLYLLCFGEMVYFFLFLSKLEQRTHKKLITGSLLSVFAFFLFLLTIPFIRNVFDMPYTVAYYSIIWIFMRATTRIKLKESLFYLLLLYLCTAPFKHVIGHVSIVTHTYNYLVEGQDWFLRFIYIAVLLLCYAAVFIIIKKYVFKNNTRYLSIWQLLWIMIAVLPTVYLSDIFSQLFRAQGFILVLGSSFVAVKFLFGICGLIIVGGIENMLSMQIKEKEQMRVINELKKHQQQYEIKKEAIDLVNQKYHDLKNIILSLSTIKELPDEQKKWIQSLYNDIQPYESIYHLGNEVLNIIVSEKYTKCKNKDIRLFLSVDGRAFAFMQPVDLAVLFGNALDNAIEGAEQLMDSKKREIIVRASAAGNYLILRFENFFAHKLFWESGQLLTSKTEGEHGFGLKSIQYIVEKYQGNLSIQTEGDHFALNVLFKAGQNWDDAPSAK
jgi:signal transduction histidine kinase